MGEGRSQKTTAATKRDLKFCWLEFAKNFEKFFLRNLTALFLTFLPTFFELVIKVKKNKKKSFGYSLKAIDMYS